MAFGAGFNGKVVLNGYDLTAYFNNAQYTNQQGTHDTTVFGLTSKTGINGLAEGTIALDGFFDSASTAAEDTVLNAAMTATSDGVALVFPAGDAIGARGRGCASIHTSYQVTDPVDGVAAIAAAIAADGGLDAVVSLHALGAETGAPPVNSAQVDNSVSSANGGAGYIEATAFTGTSVIVKIQHSSDGGAGGTWVDLITFTAISAANAKERKTVTGTVNRYLRTQHASGTFTSVTDVVAFARL